MKMLITGGTGFIGRNLTRALLDEGAKIAVVGREIIKIQHHFSSQVEAVSWDRLLELNPNQFDVIINLAGENISNNRWSPSIKWLIKESRVHATEFIYQWCNQVTKPLRIYNASAIGIYGLTDLAHPIHPVCEETVINWGHPTDFLSEVGQAWEQAARRNQNPLLHTVFLRFAPVLHRSNGVLRKMLPLFQWGMGGPLGDGRQPFSWIHLNDAIRAIKFLLKNPSTEGAINICSPHWVSQRQFAKILGKTLHRPAVIPMPAWFLKLLFGQMAEELLLSGQAVYPKVLMQHQFEFLYPTLEKALKEK